MTVVEVSGKGTVKLKTVVLLFFANLFEVKSYFFKLQFKSHIRILFWSRVKFITKSCREFVFLIFEIIILFLLFHALQTKSKSLTRCEAPLQVKKETRPARHNRHGRFPSTWLNICCLGHFEQAFYFYKRSELASQIGQLDRFRPFIKFNRGLVSRNCRIGNADLVVRSPTNFEDSYF